MRRADRRNIRGAYQRIRLDGTGRFPWTSPRCYTADDPNSSETEHPRSPFPVIDRFDDEHSPEPASRNRPNMLAAALRMDDIQNPKGPGGLSVFDGQPAAGTRRNIHSGIIFHKGKPRYYRPP